MYIAIYNAFLSSKLVQTFTTIFGVIAYANTSKNFVYVIKICNPNEYCTYLLTANIEGDKKKKKKLNN